LGRVSLSSKEIKLFEVLRGDVFFTRTSETPEEVGISSVIIEDVEDTVFSGFLIRARPINKKLDLYYKKYCFSTKSVRNEIVSKCTYTTRALTNGKVLSGVQIIVPPLPEQQAIATALSDIDGLINSLQKLIDKKKNIKQGAMQELLTGKRRLEGFSGEWKVKALGELFRFSGGYSASWEQLSDDGYCYLHYGDIHASNKTHIDIDSDYITIPKLNIALNKVTKDKLLRDGDVVFVDASEDDEGVSKHIVVVNPKNIPYISGLHTIAAKATDDTLDKKFRRYCFQSFEIKKQFKFYAVGIKVSGVSRGNIAKINLLIPPTVEEQTAIANILSDMDSEIEALERKLNKYKDIKQGMMQELLTGRIRLLEEAVP
jgi:type I restriction enzyme S subunit